MVTGMGQRGDILRDVMLETGTSQMELARVSGVHQPSISQFISGKAELSDDQLDRLLSCMGRRLTVVRRAVTPDLTRSERRSWLLHRRLARTLTRSTLTEWQATILANLDRERASVRGATHLRNVERWHDLIRSNDLGRLHRVMTGLARDSIEMREVSPMGGLLSDDDRRQALNEMGNPSHSPRAT